MLKEQLLKDIDLEAKAEAKKMTARVPIFRHGYEAGWYDAGDKYAELWQAAEERAARAEKALKDLLGWQGEGNPEVKKEISYRDALKNARQVITPKQSTDGHS